MKNLDNTNADFMKIVADGGTPEQIGEAMQAFADNIQKEVLNQANSQMTDAMILNGRGAKQLTSAESKYYAEVIDNEGFAGVEQLVPATVFEKVFDDLVRTHTILGMIDAVNTTGVTEFILNRGVTSGWWGALCDPIKEVIDNGFEVINVQLYKLNGYIPVCNAMLDLGPVWLDRYVRTVLLEALRISLEDAIIKGTGKDQPIGMIKDLDGAVTAGVYPDKAKIVITDLLPETLGTKVMAELIKTGVAGQIRTINPADVALIVNPADFWSKVYPSTTYLSATGTYVTNSMGLPLNVVQSQSVAVGSAVVGLPRDYFLAIGSSLEIKSSTEARFIEDQTIYLAKQYVNGRPKSNASFIHLDIAGLIPVSERVSNVRIVEPIPTDAP